MFNNSGMTYNIGGVFDFISRNRLRMCTFGAEYPH